MDPNRYRLQQHNGHRKDVSWMTLHAGPSSGKSTTQNPRKEQMASRHSSPKKRRQDRNKFKSGESPSRSNGSLRTAFPFTARADCERKQGDQDCTRWNRDRTQHWTASCANVPPTSTSTTRNCRYAASQSSHGSALSCMIALSRARLVYTPNLVRPHNGINLSQDRLGYQCVSEPPSRHRHSTRYIPL